MKIKHREISISPENPFYNCQLGREPYAKVLTDIVNTYADGFVLGINNEWGTGKTTFVKMWQQHLKNENFQTIYFNAWENDFDSNPLVALMSELKGLTNEKNKKVFKSVVEKGAVLVKNIAPALAKALIKKYLFDIDEIAADTIENVMKASTEILEEEIKEYSSKKKTIIEFRKELEKFIKQADNTKPLIFIVDELDRCRPNYAVEVLEQIKHFFAVPGIVFVLSIDKNHLAGAIKGFYGSEQIDSDEYLRRFIDLEYSIPKPSTKNFIKYLFDYYSFNDFLSAAERIKHHELVNDAEKFTIMADYLLSKSKATLRQQERIFALTRLVFCSFKINEYAFPHVLFLLIYLKILKDELYKKIENSEFTLQELSDLINDLLSSKNIYEDGINLGHVEALLLWLYNNNNSDYRRKYNLLVIEEGKPTTPIKSNLIMQHHSLAEYFSDIDRKNYGRMTLNFLLKKINLTEPIR
jgi:nucleoside-triphosphatase THEP1